jgi:TetR/AcrR family fatty acid metabolism transcriptional regulator
MRSNTDEIEPRRTFIEQARRRQIIASAIEVLAHSGYPGASLASIAQHAEVSKGVLSYHFAGKDDLLREVVAVVLADAGAYMSERIAGATTSLDALRIYIQANLEFLDRNRSAVAALVEIVTHVRAADGVLPAYAGAGREAVEALTALLERGQATGEFAPVAAYVAAVSIRASIDAVSALLRGDPSMDIGAYASQLVDFVERSVRV